MYIGGYTTQLYRPAKLRRLEDIRRNLPYLSASALASLIKDFEDQGIPELSQRKHIQEAKKVAVSKHHAYGPLIGDIPMVYNDGSSKNMLVVNFLSWLQAAFGQGGSLTQLVKEKHAANPSSPSNCWKLLMYSDEVVPGNPLGHTQARKIQVVYCLTSSKVILNPCCGLRIVALRNAWCTAAAGDRAHDHRFTGPSL